MSSKSNCIFESLILAQGERWKRGYRHASQGGPQGQPANGIVTRGYIP